MYTPEQAIQKYDRYIHRVAGSLRKRRILSDSDVSDLVQEGYSGLMDALKRLDSTRENTSDQFIRRYIDCYMLNYINGFLSHMPRTRKTEQWALEKKWELAQKKGLSFAEFAEEKGMTVEQCRASLNGKVSYISLDAEIGKGTFTLHDVICLDDPRRYIEDRIDTKRGLQSLTPEQLVVLQLHYFEGLLLDEIAERTGYSYDQVKRYNQQIQKIFFPQTAQTPPQQKSASQEANERYLPFIQETITQIKQQYRLATDDIEEITHIVLEEVKRNIEERKKIKEATLRLRIAAECILAEARAIQKGCNEGGTQVPNTDQRTQNIIANDNEDAEYIARQLHMRDFPGDCIVDILPDI